MRIMIYPETPGGKVSKLNDYKSKLTMVILANEDELTRLGMMISLNYYLGYGDEVTPEIFRYVGEFELHAEEGFESFRDYEYAARIGKSELMAILESNGHPKKALREAVRTLEMSLKEHAKNLGYDEVYPDDGIPRTPAQMLALLTLAMEAILKNQLPEFTDLEVVEACEGKEEHCAVIEEMVRISRKNNEKRRRN